MIDVRTGLPKTKPSAGGTSGPEFIAFDSVSSDTGGSVTIPIPAARQSGDLLVISTAAQFGRFATWSTPAGWTPIHSVLHDENAAPNIYTWYKVSDGTETNVTVSSLSAGFDKVGACVVFRDAATVSSGTSQQDDVVSENIPASSLGYPADSVGIRCLSVDDDGAGGYIDVDSPAAGWTLVGEENLDTVGMALFYKSFDDGPSSTGVENFPTDSSGNDYFCGSYFALSE